MIRQGTKTHLPGVFPLQQMNFKQESSEIKEGRTFNYLTAATHLLSLPGGPKSQSKKQHARSQSTYLSKCYVLGTGNGSVIENSVPSRGSSGLSMGKSVIKESTVTRALRVQGRYSSQAGLRAIINFFLLFLIYSIDWGSYSVISYPPQQLEMVGDALWRHELLSRSLPVGFRKTFIFLTKEEKKLESKNDLPGKHI